MYVYPSFKLASYSSELIYSKMYYNRLWVSVSNNKYDAIFEKQLYHYFVVHSYTVIVLVCMNNFSLHNYHKSQFSNFPLFNCIKKPQQWRYSIFYYSNHVRRVHTHVMNKFPWQNPFSKIFKRTTTRLRNHSSIHDKNFKGDYQFMINDILYTND